MLLRRGLRAGREVNDEDRDEVTAALEVRNRAVDAEARPRRGRNREQIDAEILGDRRAFLLTPGEIGVEQQLGVFRQRLVHGSWLSSTGAGFFARLGSSIGYYNQFRPPYVA